MIRGQKNGEEGTRIRIIDATRRLISCDGFGAASVAAVAHAAGVSRTTVYSAFGSRENMVAEAVAEIVRSEFAGELHAAPEERSLVDVLVMMIIGARHRMCRHPLLHAVVTTAGSNPLFDPGMKGRARRMTAELLDEAVGEFPDFVRDRDDLIELVLTLATDAIILEDPQRSDDALEAMYRRWLTAVVNAD